MAEDLRQPDSGQSADVSERIKAEVAVEALRQSESCLYMSTQLFIWLRRVRIQHKVIVLAPIVLTALAGFSYAKEWLPAWGVAVMAFMATLIPSIAEALDVQTHVDELKRLAGDWKSLQDRFRQLAKITSLNSAEKAEAALAELMDKLDTVRSASVTPPEKYYQLAKAKIGKGDYDFSIDIKLRTALENALVKPLDRPQ